MKKILIFIVIIFIIYYINNYMNGWLINIFTSMPKLIALTIAIIALIFPRDYDKFPEILQKTYNNYNKTNIKKSKINLNSAKYKRNVSNTTKKYIAASQKWNCNDCTQLLDHCYEVDHKIPLYKGGTNDIQNLQALCRNCHGRKTMIDNTLNNL